MINIKNLDPSLDIDLLLLSTSLEVDLQVFVFILLGVLCLRADFTRPLHFLVVEVSFLCCFDVVFLDDDSIL